MIVIALWVIVGFLSILVYPHTPGKTDIDGLKTILAFVFLWPFALYIAYEVYSLSYTKEDCYYA